MFDRANTLSEKREGYTSIILPDVGRSFRFKQLRAGDFFMHEGRLMLKTNLVEAVEVPNGSTPMVGTSRFSANTDVRVVNVKITLS